MVLSELFSDGVLKFINLLLKFGHFSSGAGDLKETPQQNPPYEGHSVVGVGLPNPDESARFLDEFREHAKLIEK